ncbi:PREDICTED: probable pectinesterase/pectinesterase inhibitor 58 isoform X2 [Tarenaya hassleriana]|uniref:probable pectinesterase/pectinesterase inhibitor 58 isoform X2 n=1 Tax=Tarenaya hassleriana TaxID=28532 RepID=UPI00053CA1F2|nr:PREDICTED: probable pectinesterase/pectinesterase inhibitor 58 isoform X2 [Tarenaya hassleriana]
MGLGDDKKKKCMIAGGISALLVVMVVSVAVATSKNTSGPIKHGDSQIKTTTKAVQAVCEPTDYKETCVHSLMAASPNSTQPLDLIRLGFNLTINSIHQGIKKAAHELKARAEKDPETKGALDLCQELMIDAIDDLKKCFDKFDGFNLNEAEEFVEDLRVWLSGSIAFQQTCMDTFEEIKSDLAQEMAKIFKTSKELTSNGLAMVSGLSMLLPQFNITGVRGDLGSYARKLLSTEDGFPTWMRPEARKLMAAKGTKVKPNAVVALDGSGQFKSINAALKTVPMKNKFPFVIYIKQGIYKEKVDVTKTMSYVTFIGDGPTKTRITGNLNFGMGKVKTYQTATVAVNGEHFTAKDIGFENTAGPKGHQAVALRVSADYAVFHNCQIDGYQDTLYAHSHRQFYRDCTISGTIDYIFGDAKSFFQNCNMVVRKPMGGQSCMVTAQGRTDKRETTGIVLHNCRITGDPAYIPVKKTNKAYLGRPWKQFSRTIIMRTTIEDIIDPKGWLEWNGNFALDTLEYAEFENKGPGSNQATRVKWPGIKKFTPRQAGEFTAGKFLQGGTWIPQTQVPYLGNM